MASELRGVSVDGVLYARVMNAVGLLWNGVTFEAYSSANYAAYCLPMAEQGDSGVYLANFPVGVTTSGTYLYFVHRQLGGAPAEGDPTANAGKLDWTGTAVAATASGLMAGAWPSGAVIYARVMNAAGAIWNGTAFEAYAAGNYSTYVLPLAEQGVSGVYAASFPPGVVTAGRYEYFVHLQAGGAPAEGDQVVNTGVVAVTTGTSVSGAMAGSDFRNYVLRRGFRRTDKDTELYEAVTDAIQELRRRFSFDEAEVEMVTTDTITTLGDFRIPVEADLGLLLGVVVEDGTTADPLTQIDKARFDALYPDQNVTADRGYPEHFCVYAGQVYLGPIPDQASYVYRVSYSTRAGTVTAASAAVPFTNLYRDMLADLVLSILFDGLEEYEKAGFYRQKFEAGMDLAVRRERKNAGKGTFAVRVVDC